MLYPNGMKHNVFPILCLLAAPPIHNYMLQRSLEVFRFPCSKTQPHAISVCGLSMVFPLDSLHPPWHSPGSPRWAPGAGGRLPSQQRWSSNLYRPHLHRPGATLSDHALVQIGAPGDPLIYLFHMFARFIKKTTIVTYSYSHQPLSKGENG